MENQNIPPVFTTVKHIEKLRNRKYRTALDIYNVIKFVYNLEKHQKVTVLQTCEYLNITYEEYLIGIGFLPPNY